MSYRPNPEVQCCTGNVNRTMPNYAWRVWMQSADEGIAAVLYGPSQLETTIEGVKVCIQQTTRYPFEDTIEFAFDCASEVTFPFSFRVPGWCQNASLTINGEPTQTRANPTFITLKRAFKTGDTLRLHLPMSVHTSEWPTNGLNVHYGPLLMCLKPEVEVKKELVDSTIAQRQDSQDVRYSSKDKPVAHPDFSCLGAAAYV